MAVDLLELDTKKPAEVRVEPVKADAPKQLYPMVEECTFRAIIQSEAEGMKLLRAIQIMVNEMGAGAIIGLMDKIEKKPQLMQQAKTYLPYILNL